MSKDRFDIHQHITDRIIAAIRAGRGPVADALAQAYWGAHSRQRLLRQFLSRGQRAGPLGRSTGQRLRFAPVGHTSSGRRAESGATVRKGQKASYVVFYKQIEPASDDPAETDSKMRVFARATPVFNADQVDGLETAAPALPVEGMQDIEGFIAGTGATIVHGGRMACYVPYMPPRDLFVDSETSSATDAYYSTLLHELTHWTGPAHRCDRDLSGRFGSDA